VKRSGTRWSSRWMVRCGRGVMGVAGGWGTGMLKIDTCLLRYAQSAVFIKKKDKSTYWVGFLGLWGIIGNRAPPQHIYAVRSLISLTYWVGFIGNRAPPQHIYAVRSLISLTYWVDFIGNRAPPQHTNTARSLISLTYWVGFIGNRAPPQHIHTARSLMSLTIQSTGMNWMVS